MKYPYQGNCGLQKPTEKAYLFVFNNIAIIGGLEDYTILFPPALLLEANEFTPTFRQPSPENDKSQ